jgi:hypothetical protein
MKTLKLEKINSIINHNEYSIKKLEFVKQNLNGNIQSCNDRLYSELSNTNFSKIDFLCKKDHGYDKLYAYPYMELNFTYENHNELIKIFSIPEKIVLASTGIRRVNENKNGTIYYWDEKVIRFYRSDYFSKKLGFKKDLSDHPDCIAETLKFIKKHKNHKLITTYLSKRIKKLLAFF